MRPGWIIGYANQRERFIDIAGNLLFVQIFMGILVQALTQSLNQERRKSDSLLRSVLPESTALFAILFQKQRYFPSINPQVCPHLSFN